MTFSFKVFSATASALALSLVLPLASMAQSSEPKAGGYSAAAPNAATSAQSVDDVTLQRTAKAYLKVSKIVQNEKSAVSSASDDSAKTQAAKQAESEKMAAVKAEGLEPQQYNHVLQLVQNDTSVQQRFLAIVNGNNAGSPAGNM